MKVHFQVEKADRSVGIMAEGFAAWEIDSDYWVDLVSMDSDSWDFRWYFTDSGEEMNNPPRNHFVIERLLRAYVEAYYAQEG